MRESSTPADHRDARRAAEAGFFHRALPRSASRPAMALAALGSLFLVAACDAASGEDPAAAPPLPQVTVAAPVVETVDVYEDVVGRFTAVQSVEIRPQVSGRLAEVAFTDGQQVSAGDPLFVIERDPFEAAVARAEAELARARAQAALARSELARAETLLSRDTMSREEHDQRARAAAEADATVRAAEANLRTAQINLGYTSISAPIDGRASDRRIDPGNLVSAGESLLTTIVSQDPIHVEFALPPEVAGTLALGDRIDVRVEGEAEFAHHGRVDFIDNQVDARAGVVRLRAVVENKDGRFAPGQFVRVRFARQRIADALLVPDTAVSSDQSMKYVLVVNGDNVVEPRPIVPGPVVDGMRVVSGGLEGKELVIVGGGQMAFPGMQVVANPEPLDLASR